jgi:hypothetical protein
VAVTDGTVSTLSVGETVTLATHDGSAKAGVDYTATSKSVVFPPYVTIVDVSIPVLAPKTPKAPDLAFTVSVSPSSSLDTGATTVHVVTRTDLTPPTVLGAYLDHRGPKVTGITLDFSKAMDPVSASDPSNYGILDPTRLHFLRNRFQAGTTEPNVNTELVAVSAAKYDPATHSVTITPATPVRANAFLSVTNPADASATGEPPVSKITDASGNLIGNVDDAPPGSFFVNYIALSPPRATAGGKAVTGHRTRPFGMH